MAWLWSSWEEYVGAVQPVAVNSPGLFGIAERGSLFATGQSLYEAAVELDGAVNALCELGFTGEGHRRPPGEPSIVDEAKPLVIELVHAGEELLLYHKRLATSQAAYGFLHQHYLVDHWDRYEGTNRLPMEIDQLVVDTNELLNGYLKLIAADEDFLAEDRGLPLELLSDFRQARNLFSVGFDEVGLFLAGRGLEGVLRKLAEARHLLFEVKGKLIPASEADFNDLIEIMSQLRWKTKGTRLIGAETKALLNYLRSIRNGGAHSVTPGKRHVVNPRETAIVVTETAKRLWKDVATARAHLATSRIQKTW